jgi:hypothetical protein
MDAREGRTDDLSWATTDKRPVPHCMICGRRGATDSRPFGTGANAVRVPYCPVGKGCRDGRIYHGPQAAPHWPGDPCDYCATHGGPKTGKRIAGNRAKSSSPAVNRKPWHR